MNLQENTGDSFKENYREGEITLFDLWRKLRKGYRLVVGGAVLGVAVAAMATMAIPAKYEAVALVQVGQIGQVGQAASVGQVGAVTSTPVEAPAQAVERMKAKAFVLAVATKMGDEQWIRDLRNGVKQDMYTATLPRSAGVPSLLIELRARGASPEKAKAVAEGVVSLLSDRHAELAAPTAGRMTLELKLSNEKLAQAETEAELLRQQMKHVLVKDDRFTQMSLMTSMRLQRQAEVFWQRQYAAALSTALSAPATQRAKVLESIFVDEKLASPKIGLLLAFGLIGGLVVGVVAVLMRGAWRSRIQSRPLDA